MPAALPPTAQAFLEHVGERSALVVTTNGRVTSVDVTSGSGLAAGGAAGHPDSEALVGSVASDFASVPPGYETPSADSLDHLANAYVPDACVLSVARGAVLRAPVVVVHHFAGSSVSWGSDDGGSELAGPAHFTRTVVHLGEDSEATVVELLVSGSGPMLVMPIVELRASEGARLTHASVQQLGPDSWQIGHLYASAARDATFRSFEASLGGAYARSRLDSALTGQGGSAQLLAAYLGDGDQMHDFRTLQEHAAPRTTSDLVFKGAVGGRSRSVYSGLIRMRRGAKGANAFQTNRNLVLSDGAHADSVPNLDIEENDVRCSHASAVGPIDAEQRFYLESRGVPTEAAERLILLGFFGELLERVPGPVARHVAAEISERVGQMTEAGR